MQANELPSAYRRLAIQPSSHPVGNKRHHVVHTTIRIRTSGMTVANITSRAR